MHVHWSAHITMRLTALTMESLRSTLLMLVDAYLPMGHVLTLQQTYSNGMSEVVLGNAIKKLNLPRDELVIMTKVN